jgi:hypothetical protein
VVNDSNSGWAGILNGDILPTGVYTYILTIYEENGTQNLLAGSITLIKE